ncbi:pyridoxamine 5'-phosphate oxidase family protein [Microbacterium elymi]|uniref:Pyridoxamine 5'-phosphate oxidase family protein n=1 Tax=Microbacterium elymi TaxID=2909587 RepID=A0ABY5NHU2_9MICO|nr:pyridoxamine 5'-phosphate oxidase family protein [Microbacterium elymi]UUT34727.1 pyridoxamine 5'-phosphate oxidase family protein [Microbacterium elymi]
MSRTPTTLDASTLRTQRTILLSTRKRDGSWVSTPVSIVVDDDGRLYFRTYDAAGKYKRLRNFPQVRVAPATTLRGVRPDRPWTARRAASGETTRRVPARSWRPSIPCLHRRLVPWLHRRKGWTTVHYELTLDD